MDLTLDFVARHGAAVIFALVFLDQLGLPIPSVPLLLAFGALAGSGRIDPWSALAAATAASVAADFLWFRLGRWKGQRALALLCRVSLEPDTCVNKTRDLFARHGVKSLLVAKFVPGFDTVAPPIAGMLGVGTGRFLLWSCGGALLWLLAFGGLGFALSEQIDAIASLAARFGSSFGLALLGAIALYLGWKYAARRRVLRSLRMARITADELHRRMAEVPPPIILDARSRAALDALPFLIEGARWLAVEAIEEGALDLPREQDIVVYCS